MAIDPETQRRITENLIEDLRWCLKLARCEADAQEDDDDQTDDDDDDET